MKAVVYDFRPGRAAAHCRPSGKGPAGGRCAAHLAARAARARHRRHRAGPGAGLQPQALGGADPLPRRRAPARSTTTGWRTRSDRSRSGGRTGCSRAPACGPTCGRRDELIQSAKLNGLDPYAYLKDVLQRLPTQKVRLVGELLPHRWAIYPIECTATAADGHNSVAMLVRREGETLAALLQRLENAIAQFYDDGAADQGPDRCPFHGRKR
jgi:hypothetical protein